MLEKLHTGFDVDQAIVSEEEKLVCIRFGWSHDPNCMRMDDVLQAILGGVSNVCTIYTVDTKKVVDFNKMYELYDPVCLLFFYKNNHINVETGSGNNSKINWVVEDKDELADIIMAVYNGARKGRGCVQSPKDYSGNYAY